MVSKKGKHIKVRCHSGFMVYKKHRTPWSDVWLEHASGHGRKKTHHALTLISKPNVEWDLDIEETCLKKYGEKEFGVSFQQGVDRLKAILIRLETEPIFVHMHGEGKNLHEVYSQKDGIDRDEAEEMCRVYLSKVGIDNPVFHWKRPKNVVGQIG